MLEDIISIVYLLAVSVIAAASIINQMTPDEEDHPKFAELINTLSLNVPKKTRVEPIKAETKVTYKHERNYRREAIMAQRAKKL